MSAETNLLAKARRELERSISAHRRRRETYIENLYEENPELRELDARIRSVFFDALAGPSPAVIEKAAAESLQLQSQRADLLKRIGVPADALDDLPLCSVCGDTGMVGRDLCVCLQERLNALRSNELSSMINLRGQTFDTFDADIFSDEFDAGRNGSPRQQIDIYRDVCYDFCRRFGPQSANLLFSGPPGTGKTFLSACVAGNLVERGFSVVYETVVRQLALMEALQFGRGGEDGDQPVLRLRECDLLIIDDLGAEFTTPFAQAALLDLINTRLITGRKTLISTNLNRSGIRDRYSPALASRLEGEFLWLDFFGKDLRVRA
jgi:DNA replication protein DnaC